LEGLQTDIENIGNKSLFAGAGKLKPGLIARYLSFRTVTLELIIDGCGKNNKGVIA